MLQALLVQPLLAGLVWAPNKHLIRISRFIASADTVHSLYSGRVSGLPLAIEDAPEAYRELEGAHVESLTPVQSRLNLIVILVGDLVNGRLLSN